VFLWPVAAPKWRAVLVAYALAMALTLVYSADHFVFDVLLGWTYVIVVVLAVRWLTARFPTRFGVTDPHMSRVDHARTK
jgi:membrane-associated phospholipid phosphatase